jgi:phage shock protein E
VRKRILLFLLAALALSAQAVDVSYNGSRPAVIIDVRTAQEFSSGHIEGAVNIPYEQIGQGIATLKGLAKDSPILVYCRSGRRSAIARATLEQQGYTRILDGGAIDALAGKLKPCADRTC